MATLGWLKVGVAADTTQFSSDLKRAAGETQKFGEQLKHLAEAYLGFEALKLGAEKIKEYVVGSIEGVSATKILAERVGLSAESFGRLSYAAKLAHVDQDQFAVSLEQMSKRLGEVAIEGSGPAANALKRFGLNAGQLTRMGTEGAFMTIMKAMEGIKNPAERASVAMDLFGKSGQGMINLVARGTDELKGLGDDASRLGIALSDIDTAKVEEADQAFIRLEAAGQGFANLIVTQLSPFITELIDRYIEWGYQGTKSASFVSQGMDWVVTGFGYAVDAANVFKAIFHAINMAIAEMVSYFLAGIEHMLEGIDWVAKKLGKDSDLASSMRGWSQGFEDTAVKELDAAQSAWEAIGKGHQTVRTLVDDIQKGAQNRAATEVAKSNVFNAPGALSTSKEEKTTFGGAFELGSKDAYSAAVKGVMGTSERTDQRQIAANTARTAGAGERSVAFLQQIAQAAGREPKALTPHAAGAS
jgi:hypothetical protein